jgi:DNA binding domain, excisionase family
VAPAGDFISAEELSEWLMLGRTRTWELLAGGEIPSYKIGRLRRIRKVDVERYLAARMHDPKGVAADRMLKEQGQELSDRSSE